MKKLMIAVAALAAGAAFAEEAEKKAELEETSDAPLIWGFGNYGMYSGYQLYGSLVNSEPTMQGYAEVNVNLPGEIAYFGNLGYLGVGVWSNTDLTDKRRDSYGKAFNEWDYNVQIAELAARNFALLSAATGRNKVSRVSFRFWISYGHDVCGCKNAA